MESAEPLADASPPLRVAALVSEGADRLRYLLEDDPNRGEAYELVGAVGNVAGAPVLDVLAAHDVPTTVHDVHEFYEGRDAPLSDVAVREAFDERVAAALAAHDPDLVVLSGYLHVLTAPVLERFFPSIVNVHHADLTVRDPSGQPVYAGLRSVREALRAGERTTRATAHVVTEAVDTGPVLVRSGPFEVDEPLVEHALDRDAEDVFDAYAYAHRRWMAREGGGRVLAKTIELAADGRVAVAGDRTGCRATVDGERGFYQLGRGVVESETAATD